MSSNNESVSMARRALLTEHERDALLDRESDDARYVSVSRVRKKIDEELARDVEVLREHDEKHGTDLIEKLRDVVGEDDENGQMPVCKDCGYEVMESSDNRGEYFCHQCNAVLREEHVRSADGTRVDDGVKSGSTESIVDGERSMREAQKEIYEELRDREEIGDRVWDVVEDVSASWEDSETRLATRRKAAAEVLQHAVDTGEGVGRSSDIVEEVREKYPVEGQNEETYWRKNIRDILSEVGDYNSGTHKYTVNDLEAGEDNE